MCFSFFISFHIVFIPKKTVKKAVRNQDSQPVREKSYYL